jgi:hypothetical protein
MTDAAHVAWLLLNMLLQAATNAAHGSMTLPPICN